MVTRIFLLILILILAVGPVEPVRAHDDYALGDNSTTLDINGGNVQSIYISTNGARVGKFYMETASRWIEGDLNGPRFQYEELQRDDWTVYLYDRSRRANVYIDTFRGKVLYSDANTPNPYVIYQIESASQPVRELADTASELGLTNTITLANGVIIGYSPRNAGGFPWRVVVSEDKNYRLLKWRVEEAFDNAHLWTVKDNIPVLDLKMNDRIKYDIPANVLRDAGRGRGNRVWHIVETERTWNNDPVIRPTTRDPRFGCDPDRLSRWVSDDGKITLEPTACKIGNTAPSGWRLKGLFGDSVDGDGQYDSEGDELRVELKTLERIKFLSIRPTPANQAGEGLSATLTLDTGDKWTGRWQSIP